MPAVFVGKYAPAADKMLDNQTSNIYIAPRFLILHKIIHSVIPIVTLNH